jgi:hypothetical protein
MRWAMGGTCQKLSPSRTMVTEIMHHARGMPMITIERPLHLPGLTELRRERGVSWPALFMKAFALTALRHPVLRRAYVRWPWPHLYEHPFSTCGFMVERDLEGEPCVVAARVRWPERCSLAELEATVRHLKTAPVEEINFFRQFLRLGRLPWLVRRFMMWHSIALRGAWRARRFGTFVLSSVGQHGAELTLVQNFLAYYLSFGPVSADGHVVARLFVDHRVTDAGEAARCLVDLERVIREDLCRELEGLARIDTSSRAA